MFGDNPVKIYASEALFIPVISVSLMLAVTLTAVILDSDILVTVMFDDDVLSDVKLDSGKLVVN